MPKWDTAYILCKEVSERNLKGVCVALETLNVLEYLVRILHEDDIHEFEVVYVVHQHGLTVRCAIDDQFLLVIEVVLSIAIAQGAVKHLFRFESCCHLVGYHRQKAREQLYVHRVELSIKAETKVGLGTIDDEIFLRERLGGIVAFNLFYLDVVLNKSRVEDV